MDGWIAAQIQALAEDHPRRLEKHMDKVAPKTMLGAFVDDCLSGGLAFLQLAVKDAAGNVTKQFHNSTFRKRWRRRIVFGLPKIYLRLYKGVSSTCYSCSRVNRRMKCAVTRADRQYWELQKRKHVMFVREERVHFNKMLYDGHTDPRILVGIVDGWDSCKTTIPSYANLQGELTGQYKNFLKTKITGVMFIGLQLYLWRTFPWVKCGANLTVTALVQSLVLLQSCRNILPPQLVLLVDGGSENINLCMFGWAVSLLENKQFTHVKYVRLPVGHTHNQLDQRYQAPSQHLHGVAAVDAHTPSAFMKELDNAYSKEGTTALGDADQRADHRMLGGHPHIADLHSTFDYDAVMIPPLDGKLAGHRFVERIFPAPTETNPEAVMIDDVCSSELHVFEFYTAPCGKCLHFLGR
jgi:hypothetical protein